MTRYCFFLIFLLLSGTATCHTLVTGGAGGGYNITGQAIQQLGDGVVESVSTSSGSVENLKRLLTEPESSQGASLGIVQHDILLRLSFQPGGTLAPSLDELQGSTQIVRSLLALYPEFVQVVVAEESSIQSIFQLAGRPVFLGAENSGSRINALDLMRFASLLRFDSEEHSPELLFEDIVRVVDLREHIAEGRCNDETLSDRLVGLIEVCDEENRDQVISSALAMELVREGLLAAAFTTQGTLVDQPGLRQIYLRPELIREFLKKNHFYGVRERRDPRTGDLVTLPFVRAILVGLPEGHPRGLSNADAYRLVQNLYSNRMVLETRVVSTLDANLQFFVGEHMVRGISGQLHTGASDFYRDIDIVPRVTFTEMLFVVPLVLIAMTLIAYGLRYSIPVASVVRSGFIQRVFAPGSRPKHWWTVYQSWTVGSWIMILLWLFTFTFVMVIYFIRFIEKQHSILLDIENPFAGTSFWDAVFWMVTFAATGFNQDMYPNTLVARILAVVVPLSGLLLTLFVLVTQTFRSEQQAEKRACGLLPPGEIKNHVIVFGWNDRIEKLVHDLLAPGSPLDGGAHVLVVAETDRLKPFEGMSLDLSRLDFLRGEGTDQKVLDDARLEYARGAIVLADTRHLMNHNTRSILICTTLRERLMRGGHTEFPIVAELFHEGNRAYFELAGVTRLCSLDLISSRFVLSAVLNPGTSGLLISLLKFSHSRCARRIKVVDLEKKVRSVGDLSGCLFGEAFLKLRGFGILLLAVVDTDKLRQDCAFEIEFRPDSPYIFGTTDIADSYRIRTSDDLLVVLPNKSVNGHGVRFLGREGLRPFDDGKEVVLLIGNSEVGREIVDDLLPRCRKLIHCFPVDSASSACERVSPEGKMGFEIIRAPDRLTRDFLEEHRSTLQQVSRVVVLGPDRNVHGHLSEREQDDETLRIALMIKRISADLFEQENGVYLSAEMRSIDNLGLFHDVGIDQPIPTAMLLEQMLIHMVFHRGVLTEFFLKSMSLSPANNRGRLIRIGVSRLERLINDTLIGMNYDEALKQLIKRRIQLIAIQKGKTVDVNEVLLIISPQVGENDAIGYRLDKQDFLFCFAPIDQGADP